MKLSFAIIALCGLALAALALGSSAFSMESERLFAALGHMSWRPWVMVAGIGVIGSAFSLLASASKPRTAFVALFASWLPTAGSLAGLMTLTLVDTTASQTSGGAAAVIILLLCLALAALLSSFLMRCANWVCRRFALGAHRAS